MFVQLLLDSCERVISGSLVWTSSLTDTISNSAERGRGLTPRVSPSCLHLASLSSAVGPWTVPAAQMLNLPQGETTCRVLNNKLHSALGTRLEAQDGQPWALPMSTRRGSGIGNAKRWEQMRETQGIRDREEAGVEGKEDRQE